MHHARVHKNGRVFTSIIWWLCIQTVCARSAESSEMRLSKQSERHRRNIPSKARRSSQPVVDSSARWWSNMHQYESGLAAAGQNCSLYTNLAFAVGVAGYKMCSAKSQVLLPHASECAFIYYYQTSLTAWNRMGPEKKEDAKTMASFDVVSLSARLQFNWSHKMKQRDDKQLNDKIIAQSRWPAIVELW